MKKHLHGKRHSIARRSVSIGRERRRERKTKRFISAIMSVDINQLAQKIAKAFNVAINLIRNIQ